VNDDEYEDAVLSLPGPEVMGTYDTIEVVVRMECPDEDGHEVGNCGAWDYIANLWLYDEDSTSWLEISRFITTYHRESYWVVDGSHALAWLQEGGDRTLRYSWAPSWNTQPTIITVGLRMSNQGKGHAPREAIPLFTGGAFNSTYNDRAPITVDIPEGTAEARIVTILTGHGMDAGNCAEFCPHSHEMTVNGTTFERAHPEASTEDGCQETANQGTMANQAGTWWYGRGGWCPGKEVHPWVEILDPSLAAPGGSVEISYQAYLRGDIPPDNSGNIEMRSWLVLSR
jgi:hypothetical protein